MSNAAGISKYEFDSIMRQRERIRELEKRLREVEKENALLIEKAKWATEYAAEANEEIVMLKRYIMLLEKEKNELVKKSIKDNSKTPKPECEQDCGL